VLFFCRISDDLKKEARMSILQHVNIVTLLAIIFEIGHYGIVMEYVLHGALNDFVFNYDVCSLFSNKMIRNNIALVQSQLTTNDH